MILIATPSDAYEVGIALDSWQSTIADDPAGEDVETAFNGGQLNIFGRYSLGYYHRIKFSVSELDLSFDASATEVGQEGTGTQFEGQYQRRIELSDQSFFAGVGLAYRDIEYNSRQMVNNDGFLSAQFFDVNQEEMSLVLTAEKSWLADFIHSNVSWGIDISYYQPIDEGLQGFKFGIGFSYQLGE